MPLYAAARLLPAGDAAVSVELADDISREASARVLALERWLLDARLAGLLDTVPSYRALLVYYDPLVLPWAVLEAQLRALSARLDAATAPPGRRVVLPCAYGGEYGPDLEEVARRLALTPEEVVALHAGADHYVYFVGFTPGLPYMAGQPARLTIPRLDRPRTKTPAGSVAIGGVQSSIYSVESPGGFWVLGRTPIRLYDPDRADPILLRAGDHVRFQPITAAEFAALAGAVAAGTAPSPIQGDE